MMNSKTTDSYKTIAFQTPIGTVTITEEGGCIIRLTVEEQPPSFSTSPTPLLEEAKRQLLQYFAKERKEFDLPLNPRGTPFQMQVWQALQQIPYGHAISYKELAHHVQNPKGCRAVGGANGKNPIPIIIPCHRVIAANGKLGGFALGLERKQLLLDLEGYGV